MVGVSIIVVSFNSEEVMSELDQIKDVVSLELNKLADETKQSLNEVKRVAINQAWKILQLAVAFTIQIIEKTATSLSGPDKKLIALDAISKFYDTVFVVVDIPFIPNVLESVMHKYVKTFLMTLVSSTIDAMVTTFRQVGIFKSKSAVTVTQSKAIKPKRKRKKT